MVKQLNLNTGVKDNMPNKKMSPGKMKAMTGSTTLKRKGIPSMGGAAGLTAGVLAKAFKVAKELKPSGRLNIDDISRAMKNLDKIIKLKPNVGSKSRKGMDPSKPSKGMKKK